jgi:hypothetical protein
MRGVELVEQRRHVGGVDAAVGARGGVGAGGRFHLPIVGVVLQLARHVERTGEFVVIGAVGLRVGLRGLATHQRDVVVEAEVAGAVVVLQQHPLFGQRLPQIGVVVEPGEGGVVGLVLENDQPHMLDLALAEAETVGVGFGRAAGERAGRHDAQHGGERRRAKRRDEQASARTTPARRGRGGCRPVRRPEAWSTAGWLCVHRVTHLLFAHMGWIARGVGSHLPS